MNFGKLFFRKMTILYVIIILILTFGFFPLVLDYNLTKLRLEEEVTKYNSVLISSKTELKEIKGAKSYERIKLLFNRYNYIKVDNSLTGNQCNVPVKIGEIESGKEYSVTNLFKFEGEFKCTVNKYIGAETPSNEIHVSQKLYDATKADRYDYIVTPNSLKDMKKIIKNYSVSFPNAMPYVSSYDEASSRMLLEMAILIGDVIIVLVLAVIIFMNTRGYAKSNTKKTKKKKQDSILKPVIGTTIATVVLGLVLGFVLYLVII